MVECSATDLIGQYVGQTGPKTIKQLERGLGKVLFVDEAYRLSGGLFAQEAVNELVSVYSDHTSECCSLQQLNLNTTNSISWNTSRLHV